MRAFFFIIILFLVSCGQPKEKPAVVIEKGNGRQTSEMAALMLQMFEVNQMHKNLITEGKAIEGTPDQFSAIYTAKFTNPSNRNPTFKAFADLYLNTYEKVFETSSDSLKIKHNNVIQSCIACHQTTCVGPIPKIKKLLIP